MSLFKSPEEEFIDALEGYMDTKFDNYSVNRISNYLKKYKDKIPVRYKKIRASRVLIKYIDTSNFKRCTVTTLKREAKRLCDELGIEYDQFTYSPNQKSTIAITEARQKFCKYILTHYKCERKKLQEFFHVHHSTVIFYINENYKQKLKKVS